MKFEWDVSKELVNKKKHGISFEQASYVFADPFTLSQYNSEHSSEEDRWIMLGKSLNQALLVVVHKYTNDSGIEIVKIISARKATKNENKTYQKRCPL